MKQIIFSALYLLILFCLSTFVFDPTYLYYEIWWLDIPMHILGGFGVAAFAGSVFHYKNIKISYWKLFVAYLFIAVAWEIYEYMHDILIAREWNGWSDTLADIFNGYLGMNVAYFFTKK